MKAIMVMFDTLDKHFLQAYGNEWTKTPNFLRLARKTVKFNHFYVGSMPCIPARRELHTGRYGFLHRGWGPLEPYDNSMPEILKLSGIYTHLATDHVHYIGDGGATYHNRYSSYEIFRGQEGDPWKPILGEFSYPELDEAMKLRQLTGHAKLKQDFINRSFMTNETDMPQFKTFQAGLDFINKNHNHDNWFLQIETFDPHEPFFTSDRWKELYPENYHGLHFDWPPYSIADVDQNKIDHIRNQYAALVSMCDYNLGRVLDLFDTYDLWRDTLLIVNTDHGFLLGEHQWWGKISPLYNEIANIPFFIHDPRYKLLGDCNHLAQTIDIAPTILDYFGVDIPEEMMGKPLRYAYTNDISLRSVALYGNKGAAINITDKKYTYFKAPVKDIPDLNPDYTLMPMNMASMFTTKSLNGITLSTPFNFSKGCKLLRVVQKDRQYINNTIHDMLFDLEKDPQQLVNLVDDYETKARLSNAMIQSLKDNDAPVEQYQRMGLMDFTSKPFTEQDLRKQDAVKLSMFRELPYTLMTEAAQSYFYQILQNIPTQKIEVLRAMNDFLSGNNLETVHIEDVDKFIMEQPQLGETFLIKAKAYKAYFTTLKD